MTKNSFSNFFFALFISAIVSLNDSISFLYVSSSLNILSSLTLKEYFKSAKSRVLSIKSFVPSNFLFFNIYGKTKIIFDITTDLTDKLKIMERKNLNKLEEYNGQTSRLNEAERDLNNLEKADEDDNLLRNDLSEKEKQLMGLMYKKKKLQEEKTRISDSSIYTLAVVSVQKNKIWKTKLFSKINEISQNLPIYILEKEMIHIVNKNENELEMLRTMERSFDTLFRKFKKFKDENSTDLKDFERELEGERVRKKASDQKKEIEMKSKNLQKSIFERQNKLYCLPSRKIANDRNKPPAMKKIEVKEKKLEDKLTMSAILKADTDDNFNSNN